MISEEKACIKERFDWCSKIPLWFYLVNLNWGLPKEVKMNQKFCIWAILLRGEHGLENPIILKYLEELNFGDFLFSFRDF